MKAEYVIITFMCVMLIVLMLSIAWEARSNGGASPPHTDMAGLAHPERVAVTENAPTAEPEPVQLFTDEDVDAVAKMLWGEARGCTTYNQRQAVWCVCNRVDDPQFPDSILAVVTQRNQFYGYDESYPVTDELRSIALEVLTKWSAEKQGATVERELMPGVCFFTGTGAENVFREAY